MENASIVFGIIIYLILGIVLFYFYSKKNEYKEKPCFNGIRFSMFLYYIIVPLILMIFIKDFISYENKCGMWCNDSINKHILNKNTLEILYSAIYIGVSFIIFWFVYNKCRGSFKTGEKNNKSIKNFSIFNYATLIIGGISFIIFIIAMGGIVEMLKKGEYYRSFSNSLVADIGLFAIFIVPARLVTVTPFLSIYLLDNDKANKKTYMITLIVSFALSTLFYLYNAGRAPIILFGLSIFYMILKKYSKKPWQIIITLAIIGLPLLDVADSIFNSLLTGSKIKVTFNYVKYLYQFIYPFRNVLNVRNINLKYGYRFGLDYITSFLDLLPKVSFPASYENTSLYINGTNWAVLGGIPNDFVTFANLQLGILGNCILSIILGYITAILDMKFSAMKEGYSKNLLNAVLTLYTFSLIISFDFCTFIRGNFILIIISYLVLTFCKKERVAK